MCPMVIEKWTKSILQLELLELLERKTIPFITSIELHLDYIDHKTTKDPLCISNHFSFRAFLIDFDQYVNHQLVR
jgi:hypothetical protein